MLSFRNRSNLRLSGTQEGLSASTATVAVARSSTLASRDWHVDCDFVTGDVSAFELTRSHEVGRRTKLSRLAALCRWLTNSRDECDGLGLVSLSISRVARHVVTSRSSQADSCREALLLATTYLRNGAVLAKI